MTVLMRCTVPHWQGDTFIKIGTLRTVGHREVIDIYFEEYDLGDEEPAPPPKRTRSK